MVWEVTNAAPDDTVCTPTRPRTFIRRVCWSAAVGPWPV